MDKQSKKRIKKIIPHFLSEDQERRFWADEKTDATLYFNTSQPVLAVFKNLKPSTFDKFNDLNK
jgi:hypothetical protein